MRKTLPALVAVFLVAVVVFGGIGWAAMTMGDGGGGSSTKGATITINGGTPKEIYLKREEGRSILYCCGGNSGKDCPGRGGSVFCPIPGPGVYDVYVNGGNTGKKVYAVKIRVRWDDSGKEGIYDGKNPVNLGSFVNPNELKIRLEFLDGSPVPDSAQIEIESEHCVSTYDVPVCKGSNEVLTAKSCSPEVTYTANGPIYKYEWIPISSKYPGTYTVKFHLKYDLGNGKTYEAIVPVEFEAKRAAVVFELYPEWEHVTPEGKPLLTITCTQDGCDVPSDTIIPIMDYLAVMRFEGVWLPDNLSKTDNTSNTSIKMFEIKKDDDTIFTTLTEHIDQDGQTLYGVARFTNKPGAIRDGDTVTITFSQSLPLVGGKQIKLKMGGHAVVNVKSCGNSKNPVEKDGVYVYKLEPGCIQFDVKPAIKDDEYVGLKIGESTEYDCSQEEYSERTTVKCTIPEGAYPAVSAAKELTDMKAIIHYPNKYTGWEETEEIDIGMVRIEYNTSICGVFWSKKVSTFHEWYKIERTENGRYKIEKIAQILGKPVETLAEYTCSEDPTQAGAYSCEVPVEMDIKDRLVFSLSAKCGENKVIYTTNTGKTGVLHPGSSPEDVTLVDNDEIGKWATENPDKTINIVLQNTDSKGNPIGRLAIKVKPVITEVEEFDLYTKEVTIGLPVKAYVKVKGTENYAICYQDASDTQNTIHVVKNLGMAYEGTVEIPTTCDPGRANEGGVIYVQDCKNMKIKIGLCAPYSEGFEDYHFVNTSATLTIENKGSIEGSIECKPDDQHPDVAVCTVTFPQNTKIQKAKIYYITPDNRAILLAKMPLPTYVEPPENYDCVLGVKCTDRDSSNSVCKKAEVRISMPCIGWVNNMNLNGAKVMLWFSTSEGEGNININNKEIPKFDLKEKMITIDKIDSSIVDGDICTIEAHLKVLPKKGHVVFYVCGSKDYGSCDSLDNKCKRLGYVESADQYNPTELRIKTEGLTLTPGTYWIVPRLSKACYTQSNYKIVVNRPKNHIITKTYAEYSNDDQQIERIVITLSKDRTYKYKYRIYLIKDIDYTNICNSEYLKKREQTEAVIEKEESATSQLNITNINASGYKSVCVVVENEDGEEETACFPAEPESTNYAIVCK